MAETQEQMNDSPVEEVRLTVPITDDTTLPVLTFRTWVLGLSSCIILAFLDQFFSYRQNPIFIPSSIAILLTLPMGKFMERTLPIKPFKVVGTDWKFTMNSGPFNMKEHFLISLLANAGTNMPFAIIIVSQMKIFFHQFIHPLLAVLVTLASQLLGYGFAGLCAKLLVESPYMWWPACLADVSFYRALHEVQIREKGQLTRLQFMIMVSVVSFSYYVIPNYFFPSISTLSFVCWIWKDSITAQLIGSGRHGLGLGSFTFDWVTISMNGSPLLVPFFAIVNIMIGFLLFMYVIAPIAYWTNSYNAKRFPFFSSNLFDANGQIYNISRVFDEKNLKFNLQGFNDYSKVYFSGFYVFAFGLRFAALTASLSHFVVFHGESLLRQIKDGWRGRDQAVDIHARMMKKYKPIPQSWFYAILATMVPLAIFTCEGFGKQLQLPFWGVLLAIAIAMIFIIPLGVIAATTSSAIQLNTLMDLVIGYLLPGKPLAFLTFKSYGMMTCNQALSFLADLKLGHYLKIPSRSMFIVQVVGVVVSSFVSIGTSWWLLSYVENICDISKLPKGSPWTCPFDYVSNSATITWGIVGPSHIFAPSGLYSSIYLFFLVGFLAPVLVWVVSRVFPKKKWIQLINIPLILCATESMPPVKSVNYWSWCFVGFLFNYFILRKHKRWWSKYNYILSVGLDIGVSFMALLASFALWDVYGLDWWGLDVEDHCPLAECPTEPGIKVDGCPIF